MIKGKCIQTKPTEEEIIDIRKQPGKILYNILFPPESLDLGSTKEIYDEAVAHKPSLEGRQAEGDKKVTLKAYP